MTPWPWPLSVMNAAPCPLRGAVADAPPRSPPPTAHQSADRRRRRGPYRTIVRYGHNGEPSYGPPPTTSSRPAATGLPTTAAGSLLPRSPIPPGSPSRQYSGRATRSDEATPGGPISCSCVWILYILDFGYRSLHQTVRSPGVPGEAQRRSEPGTPCGSPARRSAAQSGRGVVLSSRRLVALDSGIAPQSRPRNTSRRTGG
jgi:hypothetical protein